MPTRAEFTFEDVYPGETFTVQLSPVAMADLYGFRREWLAESTTYDDLWAQVERFAELARPEWSVAGVESVQGLDLKVVMGLVNAWLAAVGSVPVPLPSRSSDGARSPGDSTPPQASPSASRSSSSRRRSTTRS